MWTKDQNDNLAHIDLPAEVHAKELGPEPANLLSLAIDGGYVKRPFPDGANARLYEVSRTRLLFPGTSPAIRNPGTRGTVRRSENFEITVKFDLQERFPHLSRAPITEAVLEVRERAQVRWEKEEISRKIAEKVPDYPATMAEHGIENKINTSPECCGGVGCDK